MALSTDQITSSDFLFNYKDISNELMAEHELSLLISQPRRSLFFFRRYGAGLEEFENQPNTVLLQVKARHRILEAINYHNLFITDGRDNTIDRRIAASQGSINVKSEGSNIDIEVFYFLYNKYQDLKNLRTQTGGF